MAHAISIDEGAIWARRNGRLEALKERNVSSPDNQPFGDHDLTKFMDPELYEATKTGDADKFIDALEAVSKSNRLALSLIFDQVTPSGNSLLHVAASSWNEDVMKLILIHFPHLGTRKNASDGRTPLHCAASVGNVGAVKLLLSKCRYLALQTDKNGSYPIHFACKGGSIDTIRELMEMWPDLAEIKNKKDQNILHVAAEGGKIEVVECILNDCRWSEELLNSKDVNGNTPRHLALMHNHSQVLRLLNNKSNALDVPMKSGSLSPTREAIQGGAIPIEAGESDTKNINEEIQTLLVAATLVTSVTFTAGLTLPGGYNGYNDPHRGIATMLHNRVFQVFVFFDALATFLSIYSVAFLLLAHKSSDSSARGLSSVAGPLLLYAVNCMTVAFSAGLILAVRKLPWLAISLLCLAALFLMSLYACFLISGEVYGLSILNRSVMAERSARRTTG